MTTSGGCLAASASSPSAVRAARVSFLIAATLSAHMAADTSGFLTENVPPKPQHVSASGRSTRSMPRTLRNSRCGTSPRCRLRSEWQLAW